MFSFYREWFFTWTKETTASVIKKWTWRWYSGRLDPTSRKTSSLSRLTAWAFTRWCASCWVSIQLQTTAAWATLGTCWWTTRTLVSWSVCSVPVSAEPQCHHDLTVILTDLMVTSSLHHCPSACHGLHFSRNQSTYSRQKYTSFISPARATVFYSFYVSVHSRWTRRKNPDVCQSSSHHDGRRASPMNDRMSYSFTGHVKHH